VGHAFDERPARDEPVEVVFNDLSHNFASEIRIAL
jgi:hypothetical protein